MRGAEWKAIDSRVGLAIFNIGDIQAGGGEETFTNCNNNEVNLYLYRMKATSI